MLFTNTVQPDTLRLLRALMRIDALADFPLVGGTNLALRYGHRVSVDLDLFTNQPFDREDVLDSIIATFPQAVLLDQRKQTLWFSIDGVKVDVLLHQYPYIRGVDEIDGFRLLAVEDVIPMKLEAMATRGVKKDFWDIAELLKHFSLIELLQFHQQRYPNSDPGHVLLAMTYFTDADTERINPQCLNSLTWPQVKQIIQRAVNQYVQNTLRNK